MTQTLILFGHADVNTFNNRLATHYADGLRKAGSSVERINLAELEFDPVLRAGYRKPQPLEPDLERVRRAIDNADHLVWVFPTHWAAPPAIVRALFDRLFLPGWAFKYVPKQSLPVGLLKGRSARVITTMDSPGWWYAGVLHRCIHRSFGTASLAFCGLSPVNFSTTFGVREMNETARARRCQKMYRIGISDAKRAQSRSLNAPRAALAAHTDG